jgi:hypothetical protein
MLCLSILHFCLLLLLQQKIVIKVTMSNAKSRAQAMVLASKANGTIHVTPYATSICSQTHAL